MKRLVLILITVLISFTLIKAQPINVQSAYNYLNRGKLDKAKDAIDQAINDPKTSTWAKTWFYRGTIYYNILYSQDEKYKNLASDALQISYDAYQQAIKLDEKKEFFNEIITNLVKGISNGFFNQGVEKFNDKNYTEALTNFEKSITIKNIANQTDTLAIYNAAITAEILNKNDIAKTYFFRLAKMKYKQPRIYSSLINIYTIENDTTRAFDIIKRAVSIFSDNTNFIIQEINIYLKYNLTEKAVNSIKKALSKDTTNFTLYFAIGSNYYNKIYDDTLKTLNERLNAFKETEKVYLKAIKFKPDYLDAIYNLGALYNNEAARLFSIANATTDQKKYDEFKAQADLYLQKALPHLEKAHQLQPDDKSIINSLKKIYARTNQSDKIKALEK
ncbi:MAG: hypothetical protein KA792_11005 [Bacteroidales bacterium]|nr:hypothetical protein [Bacteroidales bacterium]